jgi:hypothetical protein
MWPETRADHHNMTWRAMDAQTSLPPSLSHSLTLSQPYPPSLKGHSSLILFLPFYTLSSPLPGNGHPRIQDPGTHLPLHLPFSKVLPGSVYVYTLFLFSFVVTFVVKPHNRRSWVC